MSVCNNIIIVDIITFMADNNNIMGFALSLFIVFVTHAQCLFQDLLCFVSVRLR